ncbi:tight adherence protein B [Amycolatopsis arida]|uniref:Tight adherence protein B n=1 Tax=Amycolatopsis arida TaxID=587909 RepID=A0A1I6AYJ2_9PSEU|nr:type II secretion system F family protein [Amycolatopsis arida]TDX83899.1 tight adherence protein B [Amycolatopsis arida]SFQ73726.1 tight adherence protein B [Amycolatopsis arida]
MLTHSVLLAGSALLCWPEARARRRLARLTSVTPAHVPTARVRPLPLVFGAVAVVAVAGGPAVAAAVVLLTLAGWLFLRARSRHRAEVSAGATLAEAVRATAAELRAGAHPVRAVEAAAADAASPAAAVLRSLAATVRLGGAVDADAMARADGGKAPRAVVERLARAWTLAHRHGLPLADVLDAVCRDLDTSVRFAQQSEARMAGPRTSAVVLAVLPLAGIALGEAMGAEPLGVLTTTATGQVLLVLGCALVCAGVAWTAWLTGQELLR